MVFEDGDHEIYRDPLAEQARKANVEVWAYCLMRGHVHLILTPRTAEGLGRAVGETHRRYTNFTNARGRWTGQLFQSRFSSVAMDDDHLVAAVGYVSLNPVRARLVSCPWDWPWCSVRAHLAGVDDAVVSVRPVLDRIPDFKALLESGSENGFEALRHAEGTGWPAALRNFSPARSGCLAVPLPAAPQDENLARQLSINLSCCNRYRVDVFRAVSYSVTLIPTLKPPIDNRSGVWQALGKRDNCNDQIARRGGGRDSDVRH